MSVWLGVTCRLTPGPQLVRTPEWPQDPATCPFRLRAPVRRVAVVATAVPAPDRQQREADPGRRCGSAAPSSSAHLPRAPPAGSRARRRTPPVPGASSNSSQSARTSTPQGPPTTTSRRSNATSKGPVTSAVSSTDGPTTRAPSPCLRATARSGRPPSPPLARRASRSPQRPRRGRAQRRGHHEKSSAISGQARSPTRQLGVAAGAALPADGGPVAPPKSPAERVLTTSPGCGARCRHQPIGCGRSGSPATGDMRAAADATAGLPAKMAVHPHGLPPGDRFFNGGRRGPWCVRLAARAASLSATRAAKRVSR